MNIKESIQQNNELIEAWKLNEACLNQNDIDAMKCLLKENQELKLELSGYRQAILNNKEMLGLKEQNQELKKQVENYKKLGFKYLQDKNNNLETQQKEFINYLENGIDICDGFLDTVKSDLQEILYVVIPANKNITTRIIENETAHKIYEEILQKYKSIIGVSDENTIE